MITHDQTCRCPQSVAIDSDSIVIRCGTEGASLTERCGICGSGPEAGAGSISLCLEMTGPGLRSVGKQMWSRIKIKVK